MGVSRWNLPLQLLMRFKPETEGKAERNSAPPPAATTKKFQVIIADENPVCRRGLRDLLGKDPRFEIVAELEDGEALFETIVEKQPDVAVLDSTLPGDRLCRRQSAPDALPRHASPPCRCRSHKRAYKPFLGGLFILWKTHHSIERRGSEPLSHGASHCKPDVLLAQPHHAADASQPSSSAPFRKALGGGSHR